jgi:hypothetical protein
VFTFNRSEAQFNEFAHSGVIEQGASAVRKRS